MRSTVTISRVPALKAPPRPSASASRHRQAERKARPAGPGPDPRAWAGAPHIPLCLWILGFRCSDETEPIGDQLSELVAVVAKLLEKPVDRRLELGEGR